MSKKVLLRNKLQADQEREKTLDGEELIEKTFPHYPAPIVIFDREDGAADYVMAEYGLIPEWFNPDKAKKVRKNRRPAFPTYNARIETINEKPSFRDSFRKKRCLVPIQEFTESSLYGDQFAGHQIAFSDSESPVMFAAGIYSEWSDPKDGIVILSFAIITTEPPGQVDEAGHDRCPVILSLQDGLNFILPSFNDPKEIKSFLLGRFVAPNFDIRVERALKPGWENR